MKKKFVLFLTCLALFVLSFGLAACGEQSKYYNVTVDPNIQNGTVEVGVDTAQKGETVYIRATADAGYGISEVTYNLQVIDIDETGHGEFVMPDRDVMVSARFGELKAINTTADHGTIEITSHRGKKAAVGATVKGKVTASAGYALKSIKLDEQTLAFSADGEFSFVMPDHDANLVAEFAQYYTVKVNAVSGEEGKVNLKLESGVAGNNLSALPGTKVTVEVAPNEDYVINEVKYSYGEQNFVLSEPYQFEMPEANVEVVVTFKAFVYSVDGLYVCTSATGGLTEEYYKNNLLYFHDDKLDIGIVTQDSYFVQKDFDYSIQKDSIDIDFAGINTTGVTHSQKILKNGNVVAEVQFEGMNKVVYTFEKFSGDEISLQSGEYSATMGAEHFQTVLESNGNLFIVDSEDQNGCDLGEVSFYGNMMIINGYDQRQQIVGELTQVQNNNYSIDAVIYYRAGGYSDGASWHASYLTVEKRTINFARVGNFEATTEEIYVIQSMSTREIEDYEKQGFIVFKGGFVTVGIHMYEDFFKGFYYRQYIPYTTAENGKIQVELRFDGTEYTLRMEATIEGAELKFDYDEAQYVFVLDTNSQPIESGVEYKLGGYIDPDSPQVPDERDWLFKYDEKSGGISIYYYAEEQDRENGVVSWGAYQYNRVKVYGDKFICYNEELANNIVVGRVSNLQGAIQIQGCEYQGEDEHFVFTWTLTK